LLKKSEKFVFSLQINLPKPFMKCFIYALVAALMLTGCKKTETKAKSPVANPYPEIVVGVAEGDGFRLENEQAIKSEWQRKPLAAGLSITGFEIIKSKSTGEVTDFYMLLAKTSQGTQFAALLEEKDGNLFFNEESGIITSCRSKTGENFKIEGINQNGRIRLYCAACTECEKTEGNI
jgi:hypothetical protein